MAKGNKGTQNFQDEVESHLEERAFKEPLFAKAYANKDKSIDKCIAYMLNEIKASGKQGWTDNEVFSLAIHYYSEPNLKSGSKPTGTIIINHHVELTDAEIAKAKSDAKIHITKTEESSLKKIAMDKKAEEIKNNLTPDDIALAKKKALKEVVEETKTAMTTKTSKKPIQSLAENAAMDLFATDESKD